jgi:hypothetical protein
MKRRITFSFKHIFEPTPKPIIRVQNSFKAFSVGILGATYVMENSLLSFWLSVSFGLINELIGCFGYGQEN